MSNERYGRLGIRGKLLLIYMVIVAALVTFIGVAYYETTWESVFDIAKINLLSLAEKNNQIIDQKLQSITQYTNGLMVDKDMRMYLDRYQHAVTPYEVFALDRPITALLNKYFLYMDDIISMNILTERMSYGPLNNTTIIPAAAFLESRIRTLALEGNGRTVWIPTYHFFDEYQQKYIKMDNDAYQRVFSAVKRIRTFHDGDTAILVINFLDRVFSNVFDMQDAGINGQFMIVSQEGSVIAHSDRSMISQVIDNQNVLAALNGKSGVEELRIDDQQTLLAYCKSSITGWNACIMVKRKDLMAGSLQRIIMNMMKIMAVFLVTLLIIIAYLTSGILTPIDALQKGMRNSGHGEFDVVVQEKGIKEMRGLIRRYNKMNTQIRTLIRDNYQMVILKREEELNFYNLQINPHFILNSMNLINLELIRNGQNDLSGMVCDLSAMMNYTLHTNELIVPFRLDWEHTCCYLKVMSRRFRNAFSYTSEIDPLVLDIPVPKFLLQPLIENCIVHGFGNMDGERSIHIQARRTDDRCSFLIIDNGRGLTAEEINRILASEPTGWTKHDGGINNTRFRIKYLYGNHYDLQITSTPMKSTRIEINLPIKPPFEVKAPTSMNA